MGVSMESDFFLVPAIMIRGSQRNDFWGELRALERFGMNSTSQKVVICKKPMMKAILWMFPKIVGFPPNHPF